MAEGIGTIGFLGPQGTHSEEVAIYLEAQYRKDGERWTMIPHASIYDVICAVANGILDCGVVPVENSIEGSINITLDTLAHEVDLQIDREIVWFVHNQLMVKNAGEPVETILSHPQPLAQCREYLKTHYGSAVIQAVSSTAQAAAVVAEGKRGYAAIGTNRAGELYGLTAIATDIQDNMTNCTRFLVLTKRKEETARDGEKTSLICQINGEKAGSLCEVLLEFAKNEVNLTRIESRPARTGLGEYIFFLDLDSSGNKANVKASIEALRQKSLWIKDLGAFHVNCYDSKSKVKG